MSPDFRQGAAFGIAIGVLAAFLVIIPLIGAFGKLFAGETWIVGTIASYHYSGDGDKQYEQKNGGLGIEQGLTANLRAVGGMYRNSSRRDSLYVGLAWAPIQYANWRLGMAALFVGGYETAKDPELIKAVFPVISWEGKKFGINIPMVPSTSKNAGAIGLQIKVRW